MYQYSEISDGELSLLTTEQVGIPGRTFLNFSETKQLTFIEINLLTWQLLERLPE